MNQQQLLTKQVIDFQKITLDNVLNNVIMLWGQTAALFEMATWLPEGGKRVFREMAATNQKGCENIKNAIDEGYSILERTLSEAEMQQQAA